MKFAYSLVVAVAILTSLGSALLAEGKKVVLSAPPDAVFEVLKEVIAGEYRIEGIEKESMTVSFRTGMSWRTTKGQDGSCVVLPQKEDTASMVVCNTEKRGSQLVAWGEGGAIQGKVLKLLTKELAKRELIPASEVVK